MQINLVKNTKIFASYNGKPNLIIHNFKTTNDPEFVFSPEDAKWRFEHAILSQNWPLNEQHFWPGKSYDYTGYVDIIAAGRVHPIYGRPNILLPMYLNEIEKINKVLHKFNKHLIK